jgi:predicted DCC family thiol-disulfide oxidoreductase YuxK
MNEPVVLFDGMCNLCNGAVNLIIDRDPAARFRFASLQSQFGQRELRRLGLPDDVLETIVLLEDGQAWMRSTAALRIARRLGFPWVLAYSLIAVPRPVRDWAYDIVARNRFKWFGRRERCRVPTPEIKGRFVE